MDLGSFKVLVRIALANLVASRLKTFILGGIILFGTLLIVVGGSLVKAMEQGMRRSIQSSVAGHIQIYSDKSKDDLAIWGTMSGGDSDLSALTEFDQVRDALKTVPHVKTVVPMGISGALIQSGNTIDVTLAELRKAVNRRDGGDTAAQTEIDSLAAHVRQIAQVLERDSANLEQVVVQDADRERAEQALARAVSDALWEEFKVDPYGTLEFLENEIAPLAVDADQFFIRYIGTDTALFSSTFDRMEIVDGQKIPDGQRGLLFPKLYYEDNVKLKNARRLDRIQSARAEGRTIATDKELERFVKENASQVSEIVLQLDPIKTERMRSGLQAKLGSQETDLSKLLTSFFETTDDNFDDRYAFFYSDMAPLLNLYRVPVGSILTIQAFTRSGFVKSVNVKVYGTFQFNGLEKSAMASSLSVMDIISFRELYGYLTADKVEEINALKAATAVKEVSRENAEAELFGSADATIVASATPGIIDEDAELAGAARALHTEDLVSRVYSQDELDQGVVLNAAVILDDEDLIPETMAAINAMSAEKGLGIKAVSWQEAAGLVGQMVSMFKLVLYVVVLIIFVVALVIMNNAMMMATLERVREFGTLRAIGAQRGFVLNMLLVETLVMGVLFGALGLALGSGIVALIGAKGIPAFSDVMFFFFSGPRLRPAIAGGTLVAAFVIVTVVSLLACYYPAFLATRISPLQAMQTED